MKVHRQRMLWVAAGLMVATASHAAEPQDIIDYRIANMKASAGHMAAANAIIRGKVDYKNQLADHARALQAVNRDIVVLFPKDSDFGDTRALDAVWSRNAEFQKRAQDARAKADAFAKAVVAGDSKNYAARFGELNDACKACHKDFRKEEK
jgi:cytochrome c556